jgi:GT2 family glycosyltransferase
VLLRRNRGFAAAANLGLERARARGHGFVWLLNNDVRFAPDCHARLLEAASGADGPVLVTPDLVSPSGVRQHVGGSWAPDGSRARLLAWPELAGAERDGSWLTGTALFCRTTTAARIGAFDESYFAYWEDVDWSFRARGAGVELRVAPDAAVTHVNAASSGGAGSPLSSFLIARNEILFARKHVARPARRAAILRVAARQIRWATLLERRVGRDLAASVLSGLLAGLVGGRGRPRPIRLPAPCVGALLQRPLAVARRLEAAAARQR